MFLQQIGMEAPEFKDFAKEMVDYIAEYLENIRDRWVLIKMNKNWKQIRNKCNVNESVLWEIPFTYTILIFPSALILTWKLLSQSMSLSLKI